MKICNDMPQSVYFETKWFSFNFCWFYFCQKSSQELLQFSCNGCITVAYGALLYMWVSFTCVHVGVYVCVRKQAPIFVESAYLTSKSFATKMLAQQWWLQSRQVKRMIFLSKAGASIL